MRTLPFIKTGFYISPGMVIDGAIKGTQPGIVAGTVNGDIRMKDRLVVEKNGCVNGHIYTRDAIIKGTVKGNIHCEGKLYAQKTAYISGNVFASETIIDKESIITGTIVHTNNKEHIPAVSPAPQSITVELPVMNKQVEVENEIPQSWF